MASIDRQPNGRWRVQYRDPQGRSRSRTFDRKAEAERFLSQNDVELRRGEWIDPASRRTLFAEWAEVWWQTTVRLRPTTRRGYWQILQNHVLPHFGQTPLTAIDYMDVERFVAEKHAEGEIGSKKIRDCVSVVSLIMQSAVKSGVRRDNPAAGHRVTVRRRRIRQGDVLTMEQVHDLLEHVKDPYKPAVWLLVLTGMRPSELCGLRVRSVDFARHLVSVTESLVPVSAFSDQKLALVEGPPKTEAGDRTIPIPEWLSISIAAYLRTRVEERGRPLDPREPLFVNRVGKPLNRDKFRETVIKPALAGAGLPMNLRTYDLRHGHASMLIDLGANVLAVAQRMGHSDPSVTLREYGHLFQGVQEQLSAKLDELRETTSRDRLPEGVDTARAPASVEPKPVRRRKRVDTRRGAVVDLRRRGPESDAV